MNSQLENNEYDLKSVNMPYLAGSLLRLMVSLLEGPLSGLLAPSLLQNAGITSYRERRVDASPTLLPTHSGGTPAPPVARVSKEEWPGRPAEPGPGFSFATVHDYAASGHRTHRNTARTVLCLSSSTDTSCCGTVAPSTCQCTNISRPYRRGALTATGLPES